MTAHTPICVIGAGTMGRGIAQIALAEGHHVSLVDPVPDQLEAAKQDVAMRLARRSPAIAESLDVRLSLHTHVEAVPAHADTVVIEAVVESLEVKTSVLSGAAHHFGDSSILGTNTSSLSVTAIAAGCPRPERVVGMHFFNPVPVMKLVEVITGVQTEPALADRIAQLASGWGKSVARVRSSPGFIVNRVARGFYGEALRLVEEQTSSPATIDAIFRSAGGFRMGPFELIDLIGNDVNAAVTRSVWTAFNFDPRFEPSRIQDELVTAGRYGRKSGQGFYSYGADAVRQEAAVEVPTEAPHTVDFGGGCTQLEAIFERAGLVPRRTPNPSAEALLPSGTTVLVTRGKTAADESAARNGAPVVVLDRMLSPTEATGIALAASHAVALGPVAALLKQAGIVAFSVLDAPGLVLARTLAVIANEAWETSLHGVASPEDIDLAMRLGTNYPTGPFDWTERWGVPTVLELLDTLWDMYHDTRYRASRGLRQAR